MSDMRQKLLPVFLEEAGRKILQLDTFVAAGCNDRNSIAELEVAFRAAHTLKGTAALVKAEAVRSLSGRIEGLLEGHFEKGRFPTVVEYEAMQLALDRLKLLVDAVANKQAEPVGLLIEAELALKLAMAMPGRRRLVELLAPEDTVDPFAEDPALDGLAETIHLSTETVVFEDPFADDPALDMASPDTELHPPAPAEITFSDLNDPFADDPALESLSVEVPAGADISMPISSPLSSDPFVNDPDLAVEVAEELLSAPAGEDSFIARMRKRIEKESPLQTAERLARTLLSQDEGASAARQYSCCHFRVATKDYYLPIANMVEISDLPKMIHLPLAPAVVKGLINLRGQVMPVIDLGIQSGGTAKFVAVRKLVVAEAGGEKLAFLSDGIPDLSESFLGEKVDVKDFVDQFRAGSS